MSPKFDANLFGDALWITDQLMFAFSPESGAGKYRGTIQLAWSLGEHEVSVLKGTSSTDEAQRVKISLEQHLNFWVLEGNNDLEEQNERCLVNLTTVVFISAPCKTPLWFFTFVPYLLGVTNGRSSLFDVMTLYCSVPGNRKSRHLFRSWCGACAPAVVSRLRDVSPTTELRSLQGTQ